MRLIKEKSEMVQDHRTPAPEADWLNMRDREDSAPTSNYDGKRSNERIYKSPEFRRAIEDISSEFQSKTRTDGKGDRQNKAGVSAGAMDYLKQKFGKKK